MDNEYKMKIVLLGETAVGKTCIIERYVTNSFTNVLSSQQASHKNHILTSPNGKATIMQGIWDTAGQEAYRSIAPFFYRDAHAIILVYSVTDMDSFNALSYWVDEIKKNVKDEVLLTIAANKSDIIDQQKVDHEDGEKFAKEHKANFFLVSAKESVNISEVFIDLTIRRFPHLRKHFGYDENDFEYKADDNARKNTIVLRVGKKSTKKNNCC